MPAVLLLDTCGSTGSVALASVEPEPSILARESLAGRAASERLLHSIRETLAAQQIAPLQLQAVVVVHGPGSFTGVRVGLAAAKGLCEAWNAPLIAVSRLAVLASLSASEDVLALLDAGRDEFYTGHYRSRTCVTERLLTRIQMLELHDAHPGLTLLACETSLSTALPQAVLVREPRAEDALPLALVRLTAGKFDDVALIDGNYVRRTDDEIFAKPQPKIAALR